KRFGRPFYLKSTLFFGSICQRAWRLAAGSPHQVTARYIGQHRNQHQTNSDPEPPVPVRASPVGTVEADALAVRISRSASANLLPQSSPRSPGPCSSSRYSDRKGMDARLKKVSPDLKTR